MRALQCQALVLDETCLAISRSRTVGYGQVAMIMSDPGVAQLAALQDRSHTRWQAEHMRA
jgi:hypothetical protein